MSAALEREIATVVGLHSRGALTEAAAGYRKLIARGVKISGVFSNLAAIYLQTGRAPESIELLKKAITLEPSLADAHYNLGQALQLCGKNDEAVAAYRQALAFNPAFASAHINLGVIMYGQGAMAEAIANYRKALAISPGTFEVYTNLGMALDRSGDTTGAISAYRQALTLRPDRADAHSNLGTALCNISAWEEAATEFRRVVDLEPSSRNHIQLGQAFSKLGLKTEARAALEMAFNQDPQSPNALWQLGILLHGENQYEDARELYRKTLSIAPGSLLSHSGLLLIDSLEGSLDAAAQDLQGLIQAIPEPLQDAPWEALTSILYRSVLRELPPTHYRRLVQAVDDQLQASVQKIRGQLPPAGKDPTHNRRLRIGYLSSALRDHPLGQVTSALFGTHDRHKFDVHVFLLDRDDSQYSRTIMAGAEHTHLLTHNPVEDAKLIAGQRLDILIFLDGYMSVEGMRLMALRLARVQAFWLGHAGGCDLSSIDYLIADDVAIPRAEHGHYTAKVIPLRDTFHCYAPHPIAATPPRQAMGLPEEGFVFCAFNSPEKIDREVFDAWMRILKQVDGSILWLSRGPLSKLPENLQAAAKAADVDPSRLIFAGRLDDKADHLARHRHCGLFLDTLTLTASTTALDALWAGVPVLAVHGRRFSSRCSTSYLKAVGLEEMICETLASYEARAIFLAKNPEALAAIHNKLGINRETHPLFQISTFTRNLEAALETIMNDACNPGAA